MTTNSIRVFFDFIDPLSYLVSLEIEALYVSGISEPDWIPFELRPPPTPLSVLSDDWVAARWAEALERGGRLGVRFQPPELIPWSRKAHELVCHGTSYGIGSKLRRRVFEAYLLEGRDIGRIDILLDLVREFDLDPTETKAVLDVDRFEVDVSKARDEARDAGIAHTPTVLHDGRRLEGFHNRTALGTFLGT